MPALEGLHLGSPPRLTPRLHHGGDRIIDPHEADGTRRLAAAGELLLAGAEGRQVGAGPGAELEEHGLALGEPHDPFHIVADALDEAGRGLGELVGTLRPGNRAGLLVPPIIVGRAADPVDVEQANIEPDRRVERPVLIQAEGRQLVIEPFGVLGGGKVAVFLAPVGDRSRDAVDQLADRILALPICGAAVAAGHVAVEVLARDDIGRELAPGPRDLAVNLLEDHPPALVLDRRRPQVPLDLVIRARSFRTEHARDMHPGPTARTLPARLPRGLKTLGTRHAHHPFADRRHCRLHVSSRPNLGLAPGFPSASGFYPICIQKSIGVLPSRKFCASHRLSAPRSEILRVREESAIPVGIARRFLPELAKVAAVPCCVVNT